MPTAEKKKKSSSCRSRRTSVGRRSRSRTRKTNDFLLVGREPSVSQTRITATVSVHRHTNGHLKQTEDTQANPAPAPPLLARRSRPFTTKTDDSTTVQVDMVSVFVFSVALGARMWAISYPQSIVFDEQINGSHISSYLRGEMFFSFDPPLYTQLMAVVAQLSGMNTDFEFDEVGKDYPPSVPYTTLRIISAIFGALLSALVYHVMKFSGAHPLPSFISALLIATDPSLIVQSRIFTADSAVITLTMMSLYCAVKYSKYSKLQNTYPCVWLTLCGAFIGAAVSMKYSAIFTALVAYYLVWSKFWSCISDIGYKTGYLWYCFTLLVVTVLLLPVCIYIISWTVHISSLTKVNTRDISLHHSSLSSALQLTETRFTPKIITNGSIITLHHIHGRDCWLHSHHLLYPKRYADGRGSSHQQQVTCYPFVDQNNKWVVIKLLQQNGVSDDNKIRDGDEISLIHQTTGKYLNSHKVAAPLQASKQEVSGYIDYNISNTAQVRWVVEIEGLYDEDTNQQYWLGRKSHIKLIHVNTSAALSVTSNQLPDWAGGQYEIVADPFIFHENTLWVADDVIITKLGMGEQTENLTVDNNITEELQATTLQQKIYEIHTRIFMQTYRYEEEHQFSSGPVDWILSSANLVYWIHPTNNTQIHMIPNPISWITGLCSLVLLVLISILSELRSRREDNSQANKSTLYTDTPLQPRLVAVLGFFTNIVPYTLTDQPLLLYNYLPALVFLHMCSGYLIHTFLKSSSWWCCRMLTLTFTSIISLCSVYMSVILSPLVYSTGMIDSDLQKLAQTHLGWQFISDNEMAENIS